MRWHEKGIVKKMKMQIKKIEGDFTVCKVVDFSEVNLKQNIASQRKRMKRILLFAERKTYRRIQSHGRTDGELFG